LSYYLVRDVLPNQLSLGGSAGPWQKSGGCQASLKCPGHSLVLSPTCCMPSKAVVGVMLQNKHLLEVSVRSCYYFTFGGRLSACHVLQIQGSMFSAVTDALGSPWPGGTAPALALPLSCPASARSRLKKALRGRARGQVLLRPCVVVTPSSCGLTQQPCPSLPPHITVASGDLQPWQRGCSSRLEFFGAIH